MTKFKEIVENILYERYNKISLTGKDFIIRFNTLNFLEQTSNPEKIKVLNQKFNGDNIYFVLNSMWNGQEIEDTSANSINNTYSYRLGILGGQYSNKSNKIYIVVNDKFLSNLSTNNEDLITDLGKAVYAVYRHEVTHLNQHLQNPNIPRHRNDIEYSIRPVEIDAYARDFAKVLLDKYKSFDNVKQELREYPELLGYNLSDFIWYKLLHQYIFYSEDLNKDKNVKIALKRFLKKLYTFLEIDEPEQYLTPSQYKREDELEILFQSLFKA